MSTKTIQCDTKNDLTPITQPSDQPKTSNEPLQSLIQDMASDKTITVPEVTTLANGLTSLGELYLALLTEQLAIKDTKAKDLHAEIQGITDKTNSIDGILNLIMQKSQSNSKDGSVNCKDQDIVNMVEDIRKKGINNISLPNGTLKKEDIPRTFSLIGNQRQSLDQQIQQKAQAFQQATMERNQLIEFVKGQLDNLHRTIQKFISAINQRSI